MSQEEFAIGLEAAKNVSEALTLAAAALVTDMPPFLYAMLKKERTKRLNAAIALIGQEAVERALESTKL